MDVQLWVTLAVLLALVVVLVRELLSPAAAMVAAVAALALTRTVPVEVAFSGFSSTATITVAGLFVVAHALGMHSGVEQLIQRRLASAQSDVGILLRLCLPVAAASSFMANTPLVAALAPVVKRWSDRAGRPASRLLMPLSFATILGGTVTTIGTSTTLVASGLVESATGTPFGLFEVTLVGLPLAIVGTAALVLLSPRLLPDRGEVRTVEDGGYSFRLRVEPEGPLDGVTIADAGLRELQGLYVAAIDRGSAGTANARPDSRMLGGDELVIVGDVDLARDLPMAGLRHADEGHVHALDEDRTDLYQVVVSATSPLVHRTLKQVSFRGRYGAAVLAISRAGERVEGKLGAVPLQAGDALLLRAGPSFEQRWGATPDFAVVAPLTDEPVVASSRRVIVLAVTAAMVLAAGLGITSLVESVLWACLVLVATRTLRFHEALDALNRDVLLIIATAIGIGASVEASGVAEHVAGFVGGVAESTSPMVALLVLVLGTTVLTEVVTNVASAALMVPLAMSTASAIGEDPRAWAVAMAVTASSSFLTPIGYQTNTIVYGLGGYKFTDYWRLGMPLVVLTVVIAVGVVSLTGA